MNVAMAGSESVNQNHSQSSVELLMALQSDLQSDSPLANPPSAHRDPSKTPTHPQSQPGGGGLAQGQASEVGHVSAPGGTGDAEEEKERERERERERALLEALRQVEELKSQLELHKSNNPNNPNPTNPTNLTTTSNPNNSNNPSAEPSNNPPFNTDKPDSKNLNGVTVGSENQMQTPVKTPELAGKTEEKLKKLRRSINSDPRHQALLRKHARLGKLP